MPDLRKSIKYSVEQENIKNKLLDYIKIDEDNSFVLYELDNNKEKQDNILSLKDDIKKYYPSSCCNGVNTKECKRPYLSIIKYILKYHDINYTTKNHSRTIGNNLTVITKKYKLEFN